MIRFNEAIDQAMVESVAFFNAQIENERNLLLGMLGHDMRGPLQVIQMTTNSLSKEKESAAALGSSETGSPPRPRRNVTVFSIGNSWPAGPCLA